jgi:cell division protein FtsN
MITGMVVGITIGVFACVLFYLSGNVPPLTPNQSSLPAVSSAVPEQNVDQADSTGEGEIELEFYQELKNYEVPVDATPVPLTLEQSSEPLAIGYMLQAGAFEQQELANLEMRRQQALGLEVMVKPEQLPGRILYLVQSGPYFTGQLLSQAEQLLLRNNISSIRISMQ